MDFRVQDLGVAVGVAVEIEWDGLSPITLHSTASSAQSTGLGQWNGDI